MRSNFKRVPVFSLCIREIRQRGFRSRLQPPPNADNFNGSRFVETLDTFYLAMAWAMVEIARNIGVGSPWSAPSRTPSRGTKP
jgi:hypothetical protein